MAVTWSTSTEDLVCEHRDAKATTAALDCTGRFAVLAGRLGISLIDLNQPQAALFKVPRTSKWEVSVVGWNQHPHHRHMLAVASNQKVDVWNFDYQNVNLQLPKTAVPIKGHARSILDLDWNFAEPTVLVTCSVDSYVNIWDVKDVRKPVASLPSVSGASQAKWCKVGKNFLATAHEADCKIWDFRKANTPIEYITAHSAKINGIDWSPSNGNHLVTCGQDSHIKVWDISAPKKPETIIPLPSPVWRARFTPFGEALVSVGIPQLHRGEHNLTLWALSDISTPVHIYSGHTEGIYDFFWRSPRSGEFQLISWSKDQTLRLWKSDTSIIKQCGSAFLNHTIVLDHHHVDMNVVGGKENNYSAGSQSLLSLTGSMSPPAFPNFPLERELRSIDMPNVVLDEQDAKMRTCTVSVTCGPHVVKISLLFPSGYPDTSCPIFNLGTETTLNPIAQKQVTQVLTDIFNRCLKNQAMSLALGIRAVLQFLGTLSSDASPSPRLDGHPAFISPPARQQPANFKMGQPITRLISQRSDTYSPVINAAAAKLFPAGSAPIQYSSAVPVPFPRICGAHFAGDKLVRWSDAWKLGHSTSSKSFTERTGSMIYPSDLSNTVRQVLKPLRKKGKADKRPIVVFNVQGLLPVHPALVAHYRNDSTSPVMSLLHNAELADSVDRKDLAHIWRLLAVISKPNVAPASDFDSCPWSLHPFGRPMLDDIIKHYREGYDSAFLATLACIFCRFSCSQRPSQSGAGGNRASKSASVVHLSPPSVQNTLRSDDTCDGWTHVVSTSFKDKRSSSWSISTGGDRNGLAEEQLRDSADDKGLISPSRRMEFDLYKREYCDLLHSFRLLNKRAEILKCLGQLPDPHRGIEFYSLCHKCDREVRGSQCFNCKKTAVSCSICHGPVKGLSTFCILCGHGGHLVHMEEWFQYNGICPSGCGCSCLEVMQMAQS
ncbi:GATOR complex protein WDR59-like [Paramacrobiotus metropolitanus]|uniref:GATOR complex protein WDR59-like n=1 Tax=Paramacrobiotus metropolitanus TaxID=2943436 RepID=UPI002445F3F3|nr:GATOR complex protein WDR59-like [Paramacrobiotus metropolitanus]